MTDRDNRGIGQSLAQKCVDHALRGLVQGSRRLIKQKPIGLEKDRADHGQALLFAKR